MKYGITVVLVLFAWLLPTGAVGQGWDPLREGGEVVVVEGRPAELRHEFSFGGGVLPLDAFYTGWAATASYTYHPGRIVAWEVLSGFLSHSADSGLEDRLFTDFNVIPTRYEKVQWGVLSEVVLKPLYGKGAWFNRQVWPIETFLTLGSGLTKYTLSYRGTGSAGLGLRLHLAQSFSIRLDVKGLLTADPGQGTDSLLLIGLAASFNSGRPPR